MARISDAQTSGAALAAIVPRFVSRSPPELQISTAEAQARFSVWNSNQARENQ